MQNNNLENHDEMDLLLQQAFLELDFNLPKNEAMLTILSSYTLGVHVPQQLSYSTTFSSLLKIIKSKLFIAFSLVTILVTSYFLFIQNNQKITQNNVPQTPKIDEVLATTSDTLMEEPKINPLSIPIKQTSKMVEMVSGDTLGLKKIKGKMIVDFPKINEQKANEPYVFPQLTEEEIKANNKQKTKMIKFFSYKTKKTQVLYNLDNKKYAFIPMGSYIDAENDGEKLINEKEVSIQAFYMQKTEVSNLEYRTFLFDLLIQNRKDDFLKAKPDQQQWANPNSYSQVMVEYYFSHPAYNDYPVNNISRKGAEMYCKWLTEEVNKLYGYKMVNEVRLPTVYEWKFAASSGGKYFPYPWGGPYARNSNGYFMANFYPKKDSLGIDDAEITAPVVSYNPTDFGLYCMSGNVAEMVIYPKENNLAGTKGGSWTSIGYDIQINSSDKFKGITTPNVNIGFRPVITYLGRTNY